MNTKIIVGIVGALTIAGASFFGGMTYGKSSVPARGQFGNGEFRANVQGVNNGGVRGAGGGFTVGEILSKDATSITIKMQDGSTKIILIGESTEVMKSASGTLDDLSVGTNVMVAGSANSDGSVTAESVQVRPAGSSTFSRPERVNQQ